MSDVKESLPDHQAPRRDHSLNTGCDIVEKVLLGFLMPASSETKMSCHELRKSSSLVAERSAVIGARDNCW